MIGCSNSNFLIMQSQLERLQRNSKQSEVVCKQLACVCTKSLSVETHLYSSSLIAHDALLYIPAYLQLYQ
jgi:hypothetical protein